MVVDGIFVVLNLGLVVFGFKAILYNLQMIYLSLCTYSLYMKIKNENENATNVSATYQLNVVGTNYPMMQNVPQHQGDPNYPMMQNVPQLQQANGYAQVPTNQNPQMYMQPQGYPQQQQYPQAYPQVPAYQQPQAQQQPPTYHETSKYDEANQLPPKV